MRAIQERTRSPRTCHYCTHACTPAHALHYTRHHTANAGNYVSCVRSGNTLFLAGHIPLMPDGTLAKGKVGVNVTPDEANAIARQVAINIVTTLKREW
jgi:enamine deaminase RidA (YjgF/YER057c/UK114 family)